MDQTRQSRRKFLIAAGTGAAAVAAVTATQVKQEEAPAPKRAEDERAGYRLTDHIRTYYRTTLV
jgi:hypothetical protein